MANLPPARKVADADPETIARIQAWKQDKNTECIRTLISAFDDIPPEEERVHRADIWACTPDGKPAIPEAHQFRYDFTTRVWRAGEEV